VRVPSAVARCLLRPPPRALAVGIGALVLAATTGAAPRAPAGLAVPIAVRAPGAGGRGAVPIAASVPFPSGRLRDAHALWVAAGGAPVPLQPTVLERWPDGSLRWLLLDVLAPLAGDGTAALVLHDGRPPRPAAGPRLRLERRGTAIALDTGGLRVEVPGAADAVLDAVVAGATSRLGRIGLPVLEAGGQRLEAVPTGPPVVETEGAVRTEVLLRARYRNGLGLDTRLAAFAGQRWLRLQLTITHLADAPWMPIASLAVQIPLPLQSGSVGIDGETRPVERVERAHVLRQADAERVLLDGTPAGTAGDGWLRAVGGGTAVTVVRRLFREEYPQSLALAPDGVRVDLVAGGDEPVRLGRGAARTVELWIAVEPAAEAGDPAALARALRAAPAGLPPPPWIVASGALPQSLAPEAAGAASFLARLDAAVRRYLARARYERWDEGEPVPCAERRQERERRGFYGLLNWGDWNFPGYRDDTKGCDAWGNLEYDLGQVLGLAWAATNDPAQRDAFVAAVRHYRDVDVIHHDPEHPDRVGLNHPHKAGHHAPEARQAVDLGHAWVEGLVTHWRLTGELRSREAATRMADALAGRLGKARNPRHFGWPMIALAAVAQSTNEARYREAALRFARAALDAFPPTPAAADWKIGIQADGLAAVDALDGDAAVRAWLIAYGDAYLAARERFADPRYALPLGHLGAVTGARRFVDAALAVAADLRIGDWGKTLASDGRVGFRLLGPLAAAAAGVPRPAPREEPRRPAGSSPPPSWGPPPAAPIPPAPGGPPRASERGRPRPSPSRAAPARRTAR